MRASSTHGVTPNFYSGDDDIHDENVNFLRNRFSPAYYSRRDRRRHQQPTATEADPMDLDDMEDSPGSSHRMRIMRRRWDDSMNVPNYERSSNTQSLYGWAPNSDNDDVDRSELHRSNDALSAWYRRLGSRNIASRTETPGEGTDDRVSRLADETVNNDNDDSSQPLTTAETLFQSMRRQPRFTRARALQHYLLDRDPSVRQAAGRDYSPPSRTYRLIHQPESHRHIRGDRSHAENYVCPGHRRSQAVRRDSPTVKDAIRFLHELRDANSYKDGIQAAIAFGFVPRDYPALHDNDLVLDTASITLPTECSWLRPGMVFSGSQIAAYNGCNSDISRASRGPNEALFTYYPDNSRDMVGPLPRNVYSCSMDENWPVKVTFHDINYDDLTLSGTMEAYNIPDKTSPNQDAHIVTYLEGEIINFNQHTLETKNFEANAEVDSTYWRKLYPFSEMQEDDELAKCLVSRKFIKEQLAEEWVFMRWKGESLLPFTLTHYH